jgi:transposase
MPKPYSSDLRQRVIALVEAGQSRRAVARLLNIGKATVILWVKDYRATGKQAAKPMGGVGLPCSLSVTGYWRGLQRPLT